MTTTGFTHVSVYDLDESARFYKDLFGLEELYSPDFPFPVRWLRIGDLQLHLFQSEDPAPQGHHFGLDVDDFEAVYSRVEEMGVPGRGGLLLPSLRVARRVAQIHLQRPVGQLDRGQPSRRLRDRPRRGG